MSHRIILTVLFQCGLFTVSKAGEANVLDLVCGPTIANTFLRGETTAIIKDIASEAACCSSCSVVDSCGAWSYDKDGSCFLKKAGTRLTPSTEEGTMSGYMVPAPLDIGTVIAVIVCVVVSILCVCVILRLFWRHKKRALLRRKALNPGATANEENPTRKVAFAPNGSFVDLEVCSTARGSQTSTRLSRGAARTSFTTASSHHTSHTAHGAADSQNSPEARRSRGSTYAKRKKKSKLVDDGSLDVAKKQAPETSLAQENTTAWTGEPRVSQTRIRRSKIKKSSTKTSFTAWGDSEIGSNWDSNYPYPSNANDVNRAKQVSQSTLANNTDDRSIADTGTMASGGEAKSRRSKKGRKVLDEARKGQAGETAW